MESAIATALRDDPSKLRRLLEASEDLLAIIGEDGCARELNDAWEGTLGWTRCRRPSSISTAALPR